MLALKNALRSIMRKKARSGLTLVSIIIGVVSVVIIGIIGSAGKEFVSAELSSLGMDGISVFCNDKNTKLSYKDIEEIKNMVNIQSASPVIAEYGTCSMTETQTETIVWGVDSGSGLVFSVDLLHGRFITEEETQSFADVCMVDAEVARAHYARTNIVGKKVSINIRGIEKEFTIVGVTKAEGSLLQNVVGSFVPSFVHIPYTTMQEMSGSEGFEQVAIKLQQGSDAQAAGNHVIELLDQINGKENSYKFSNIASQREKMNKLLDVVTIALSFIAGISLAVSGLGIMTTMLVSVTERTYEIGLKKAIGAKKTSICAEFLLEALMLSLIGGIIGVCFGCAAASIATLFINISLNIDFKFIMLILSVCIIQGAVFGVIPAIKASKMKPVDALRQIG